MKILHVLILYQIDVKLFSGKRATFFSQARKDQKSVIQQSGVLRAFKISN